MKRAIAVILTLVLVFSFACLIGCNNKKTASFPETMTAPSPKESATTAPTVFEPVAEEQAEESDLEILKASKPNEYIQEKLAAGLPVQVAFIGYVDNQMIMDVFGGAVKAAVEKIGCEFSITNAGGNVATEISQIENYTTMGVACLVLIVPDAQSVKDAVLAAQDAGTDCVIYGAVGAGEYTIATRVDIQLAGKAIGLMAAEWAHRRYPDAGADEVKAAVLGSYALLTMKTKTDTIRDTMDEDPNMEVVFFLDNVNDTIDDGYNAMQNAMTFDPNIRVVSTLSFTQALGASNYISSMPGADISEFATFGDGYDSSTEATFEAASRNEGCFRGTLRPQKNAGEYIAEAAIGALFDTYIAPTEIMFEEDAWCEPNFDYEYHIAYD